MTYGMQSPASGNSTQQQRDSQLTSAQLRKKYNYQQQAPYAAQTGAARSTMPVGQGQVLAAPQSPVTATGALAPPSNQIMGTPAAPSVPQQQPISPVAGKFISDPVLNLARGALMNAIQNPVFSPEIVAQMKGAQQDTIATGMDQLAEQLGSVYAGRGMTDSGAYGAALRRLGTAGLAEKTNAFRDIDIQAALGNRDDLRSNIELALRNALGDYDLFLQNKGIDVQADLERQRLALQEKLGLGDLGYRYTALDAAQQQAIWDAIMRGGF